MLAGFLLSLREGLEAALVIGMVLGVLHQIKRTDLYRQVWYGFAVAAALSAIVALALLGMEFDGVGEQIFEGSTLLLAAAVLTWLILWLHRTAGNPKIEIENRTRHAVHEQAGGGLFTLAFLAVFREGVELSLFLLAVEKTSSPIQTMIGALSGLAGAALLGWMLFNSTRKMNLRGFFKITNILLIVFAAGLVASGIHEFIESGIIPPLVDPIWNISRILSDKSELGLLLKSLVGYSSAPALTELIAYSAYLIGALAYTLFHNPKKALSTVGTTGG